jgi:hypothetical protein
MNTIPASTGIQADESFDDEGFAESVNTSYVTSIASELRRGIGENGRTYPAYGKNAYGLPVDEEEQDRNDLQHCKFMLLLGDQLHLAPIAEKPQRILDLGTGSGIWAIDSHWSRSSCCSTLVGASKLPIRDRRYRPPSEV